jgi:hypothetical protein
MTRTQLIERIRALDEQADLRVLVGFGHAELEYHLQSLLRSRIANETEEDPSPAPDASLFCAAAV